MEKEQENKNKAEITYDDFMKLDIRIGTIVDAELVPDTDKLIKCTVDLSEVNEEGDRVTRTIVSGLAEYVAPSELIGKQCPYVCNLAPRKIRGILSEGMILAIRTDGGFALLHPNGEVKSGASIA